MPRCGKNSPLRAIPYAQGLGNGPTGGLGFLLDHNLELRGDAVDQFHGNNRFPDNFDGLIEHDAVPRLLEDEDHLTPWALHLFERIDQLTPKGFGEAVENLNKVRQPPAVLADSCTDATPFHTLVAVHCSATADCSPARALLLLTPAALVSLTWTSALGPVKM